MTYNIAGLIDDIDRMDNYRRHMMEELQVLRDVTLFYNEWHPELRSAVRKRHKHRQRREQDAGEAGNRRRQREVGNR